jgi:hypothetical protein
MSKAVRSLLRGKVFLAVCLGGWCLAVGAGLLELEGYANRPGDISQPPARWPAESRLPRTAERPCLLLFAHPRCPCTRATLSELERFLARHADSADACVVFTKPAGEAEGWEQTDLLQKAKAIAGLATFVDDGGIETRRFRAHTSGVAMLYGAQGRLLFYGGLTASRGHEGASAGLAALEALLGGEQAAMSHTEVFGCPLETPGTEGNQGDQECRK